MDVAQVPGMEDKKEITNIFNDMAKKDRLANLIGSITEAPKKEEPTASTMDGKKVPSELVEELGIAPEMEAKLNEVRQSRVGRPKGSRNGEPKERENRATFIVEKGLTRKLKYIALMETKLYKDVISEALSSYVERWEKNNGKINLPK